MAKVGDAFIQQSAVDAYLHYAIAFDAIAYPGSTQAACGSRRPHACTRLRRQVLGRLIEERLVLRYATRHHVVLDQSDNARVRHELASMTAPGAPTSGLFHRVPKHFVRAVLTREILVQKVEARIGGQKALGGLAVHLKRYSVPFTAAPNKHTLYQHLLAVPGGGRAPASTIVRDDWVATFRLPAWLSKALKRVHRGHFVGPFTGRRSFLLVQFLGQGTHRYGAPAQEILMARAFHHWLSNELLHTRIRCINARGEFHPCGAEFMKVA